jgi:glycine dehydrogenase subunit 1
MVPAFTSPFSTNVDQIAPLLGEDVACVVVQYPNFYGTIEDVHAIAEQAHAHGAALVVSTYPVALGLLKPPGELGADVVAAEGQSLGVAQSYGGPYVGLLAAKQSFVRQMPGRLAGITTDSSGNRGFVLTLQTREQHIRREKATSNICTNVALMATASAIAMTLLGPRGLETVARASHLRAEETKRAVLALPGFDSYFEPGATYDEFVVRTPEPADAYVAALAPKRIAPGLALGAYAKELGDPGLTHGLLITATELTTSEAIDALVEGLRSV